jgi:hypothetical protein
MFATIATVSAVGLSLAITAIGIGVHRALRK